MIRTQDQIINIDTLSSEYIKQGNTPFMSSSNTLEDHIEELEDRIVHESYARCDTSVALTKEGEHLSARHSEKTRKICKDIEMGK